ncbi:MAG: hypothetical protein CEE38_04760 [Planctomycetes bacterium B3_Pla]|nr:MAG: hypothetical protein CEE38_04760 [Planctomycetes bacterium B3_Pla]
MEAVLIGLIGAIIGSIISSIVTYRIYKRQLIANQYLFFVDELDKALVTGKLLRSEDLEEVDKRRLKVDLELSLNKAWSKALVTLPDSIFNEIEKAFSRKGLDKKARNRIYYLLRKELYPKTKISYDDIMDRLFEITSAEKKKDEAADKQE